LNAPNRSSGFERKNEIQTRNMKNAPEVMKTHQRVGLWAHPLGGSGEMRRVREWRGLKAILHCFGRGWDRWRGKKAVEGVVAIGESDRGKRKRGSAQLERWV
jgi:hypothetical protein